MESRSLEFLDPMEAVMSWHLRSYYHKVRGRSCVPIPTRPHFHCPLTHESITIESRSRARSSSLFAALGANRGDLWQPKRLRSQTCGPTCNASINCTPTRATG